MQQDKVTFYLQKNILELLPEDIRNKVAVAGGAVRDKIAGVEVKDYDLFVDSKETEDKLMKFLAEAGKEGNVNSQLANYTLEGKWIQVIRGKYYNIDSSEVIDSFDFIHCCAMVTMKGFQCHPQFYRAVATKHLMINKITFPLSTLERMQKYVSKGYSACNGTLLAIAKAINDMDKEVFNPSKDSTQGDALQNTLMFYADGSPRFMGVD
jgi:hypothetical protein